MEITEAVTLCKKHVHRYVMIQMKDGMVHEGIIESVDSENIYLAVPAWEPHMPAHVEHVSHCGCGGSHHPTYSHHGHMGHHGHMHPGHHGHMHPSHHGHMGYHGHMHPGHHFHHEDSRAPLGFGGFGPGFGPGFFGPRRRFNRVILPLVGFTALSLLPYF